MSLLSRLFKSDSDNNKTDYAKEISLLIGCEYSELPANCSKNALLKLYLDEYEKGRKTGYIPVIVVAGSTLLESIELNIEDCDSIDSYRNSVVNQPLSDSRDILNSRFEQCLSCIDDGYDVFGDFSGKINPCSCFLCVDKSDLDKDEKLVIFRIPVKEPWEIFSYIPFGGWNECPETAEMISVCKYWYENYGAVPSLIKSDTLEMYVFKPIDNTDTAFDVAKEQYGFCNDTVDQGTGTIKSLAETLVNSTVWFFWWD